MRASSPTPSAQKANTPTARLISLVVAGIFITDCSCAQRANLRSIAERVEPSELPLASSDDTPYIRSARVAGISEAGIITMTDGSVAKYWFISHHSSGDNGWTLFKLSNGIERWMEGCFCCSAYLKAQPASLVALSDFIDSCDGKSP